MISSKSNVIVLKGSPCYKEGIASNVIYPGHMIAFGGANDVQLSAVAKEDSRRAFAVDNQAFRLRITDAYQVGDTVKYGVFQAGHEIQARVAAAAAAISKGDALESAGNGTLRKLTTDGAVVAYALESVDNSGGATEVMLNVEIK
jgi:hypothetical protein